jgi:hypothetical protein
MEGAWDRCCLGRTESGACTTAGGGPGCGEASRSAGAALAAAD